MIKFIWSVLSLLVAISVVPVFAEPREIKIGATYSLTGWAAIGGVSELHAVTMALEEINKNAAPGEARFKLLVEDNHSDLLQAASAARKLITEDKVVALLGPNWAEFGEVLAPIAERYKVPMLTASAYSASLTRGRKFVFTMLPDFEFQIRPLLVFLKKKAYKRLVVVYSASTYFNGIADAVRSAFKDSEQPPRFEQVDPRETDFRSLISRLAFQKPDAILVLLSEGGDMAAFLRQARSQRLAADFYANDVSYDEPIMRDLGVANGLIFFHYQTSNRGDLMQRYRMRYSTEPPFSVPLAYDSAYVLTAAIRDCGSSGEAIRKCLLATDYKGVSGRIRFSSSGNISPDGDVSVLRQVQAGSIQSLDK